jgi:hypothetical protein
VLHWNSALIKHAWETTIVACILVWWWCSIGFSGLVVVIIVVVVVPCLVLHESRSTHSFLHHIHFRRQKHPKIPQWLIIGAIEKQKVPSYDLRIVAWYNGCQQLKNTQMTRQTQQEYAHTTHNPYYGCCAVKSNHQNFLLIAWLVLTLYVCLILSDKPTLFSFLIWPSDDDAASLSCFLQSCFSFYHLPTLLFLVTSHL